MDYCQKLIYNSNANISVLDINNLVKSNFVMQSALQSLEDKYPNNMTLLQDFQTLMQ
ncbi:MAG: hypothetical protein RLZZ300_457, partial [Pseudomonadota bacterium]